MSPKEFVFESYRYDSADGSLSLRYRFLDGPRFEERLVFDFASRRLSADAEMALDRIFRLVFLLSGVSYYKAFVPETLRCEAFPIDRDTAQKLCREVSDKNRFENCVFDVAVTGEAGFVKTYLASQRIEAGGTRTMIGDDRETSPVGAPVKFTALVVRRASDGRGTPAGSVEFLLDGSRTGQPVKLDANGRAVWTTSQLKAGRHHVVARYVPTEGSVFLPSTSFEKLHAVGQPEVQIQ
jgi:hypothetical protein